MKFTFTAKDEDGMGTSTTYPAGDIPAKGLKLVDTYIAVKCILGKVIIEIQKDRK